MSKTLLYQIGARIGGRYELIAVLGHGASGVAYKATDSQLFDQVVALKVLYPHLVQRQEVLLRFRNEVRVARQLAHPHIVRTFEWGSDGPERHFLVMEYISGHGLKALVDAQPERRLPLRDATRILYEIADALATAHQAGVVHRDLKPDNILIDEEGHAKILDFGIARILDDEIGITRTGESLGTPYYMSPEQFRGHQTDARSDLYALGILAFELVAGRVPFASTVYYDLATQHLNDQIPPFPGDVDAPEWFRQLVASLTAKEPSARPASASDVADLLAAHLQEGELRGHAELVRRWRAKEQELQANMRRRRRRRFAYGAIGFFACVFLGYVIDTNRTPQRWRFAATWVLRGERELGHLPLWPLRMLFGISIWPDDPTSYQKAFDELRAVVPEDDKNPAWRAAADRLIVIATLRRWDRDFILLPEGQSGTVRVPVLDAMIDHGPSETLQCWLDTGMDPNIHSARGDGVIFKVIESYKQPYVGALVRNAEFDPAQRSLIGDTPWHSAVRFANAPALSALSSQAVHAEEAIRVRWSMPADRMVRRWTPDLRNAEGKTPLELLLSLPTESQRALFLALLPSHPDVLARNEQGLLPIEQAAETATEQTFLELLRYTRPTRPATFPITEQLKQRLTSRGFNTALAEIEKESSG